VRVQHHSAVHVAIVLANFGKEQFDSQLTHPASGLAHSGDRNAAFRCEVIVVVAHYQQVVWYADTQIGGCLDYSDGERIRRADNSVDVLRLQHLVPQFAAWSDCQVRRLDDSQACSGPRLRSKLDTNQS
jgi:hypothetical protein